MPLSSVAEPGVTNTNTRTSLPPTLDWEGRYEESLLARQIISTGHRHLLQPHLQQEDQLQGGGQEEVPGEAQVEEAQHGECGGEAGPQPGHIRGGGEGGPGDGGVPGGPGGSGGPGGGAWCGGVWSAGRV